MAKSNGNYFDNKTAARIAERVNSERKSKAPNTKVTKIMAERNKRPTNAELRLAVANLTQDLVNRSTQITALRQCVEERDLLIEQVHVLGLNISDYQKENHRLIELAQSANEWMTTATNRQKAIDNLVKQLREAKRETKDANDFANAMMIQRNVIDASFQRILDSRLLVSPFAAVVATRSIASEDVRLIRQEGDSMFEVTDCDGASLFIRIRDGKLGTLIPGHAYNLVIEDAS
jgi:hypothetical protein